MIGACVFTIAGLSTTPLMNAALQASVEAGRNLAALFDERSPGARPAGALLDTKMAKGPRQYAKPRTRERAGVMPQEPLLADARPYDTPILPLASIDRLPVGSTNYGPPGSASLPPGYPIYSSSGGGGGSSGGGGGGGSSGGVDPTPSPSPVPEPAMWMTFIIGFGAIGFMLRRRRKASVVATSREMKSEHLHRG